MRQSIRRKALKKKYKRIVAAMAGAAVMSSAMLPMVSAAAVQNALSPVAGETTTATEQAQQLPKETPAKDTTPTQTPVKDKAPKKDENKNEAKKPVPSNSPVKAAREQAAARGYDTRGADFSLQSSTKTEATVRMRTDNGKEYRIKLKADSSGDWKIQQITQISDGGDRDHHSTSNPVSIVKANAARYGFDSYRDSFTLLSKTANKAIVQVHHLGGQTFKVDLERSGSSWVITTIRGIGNMNYPATYIPASMFTQRTVIAAPVVDPANQKILFQSKDFKGWEWNERAYPTNMHFGIFTRDPRLGDSVTLPEPLLRSLSNINYNRQMVLYANLGTVAYNGYGIGIEKVSQSGNSLFITVRTKSPTLAGTSLTASKVYDYVPINRSAVDFTKPVHVSFITPEGTALSWYTFMPQS